MAHLIEFIVSLAHKKNRGLLIYSLLNILIIVYVFSEGFAFIEGVYVGLIAYLISLLIALSPIGEYILRVQNKCKKIQTIQDHERMMRLFNEVYEKARLIDDNIQDNIKLFVSDDEFSNALATGRKTICITKGLTYQTDEEIKGVLAHEFGHLSNKDTDALLVIVVGNLFINVFYLIFRIMAFVLQLFQEVPFVGLVTTLMYLSLELSAIFLLWVWNTLGILLVSHSSRQKEFIADEFAVKCGYKEGLEKFLNSDVSDEKLNGIWKTFTSTHPLSSDRIENMELAV